MLIMKSRPGETMAAFAARAQQYAAGTAVALYFPPQGELQATAEAMQRAFPDSLTLGVATVRLFDLGALESGTTLLFLFAQDDADVCADAMLLENISKAPIGYVLEMRRRVEALHSIETNVACLEFCTNNEEMLVTTLTAMLAPLHVPLFGGTAFHTDSLTKAPSDVHFCVAWQGRLYEDACIALILKNMRGRILLYREMFYEVRPGTPMHLATKVDLEHRLLIELDDRPAAEVYSEETGIPVEKIVSHVAEQPFGRTLGEEVFVISMRSLAPRGAIIMSKAVNLNDALYIMNVGDYEQIWRETCARICRELPERQLTFAVECYHRYMFYETHGLTETLPRDRSALLGPTYGIVSGGEQIRGQHMNQTGLFLVFEGKGGGAHEVD